MTSLAENRIIAELDKLRQQGHPPVSVIDQAIIHGWKGVFPVRTTTRTAPQRNLFTPTQGREHHDRPTVERI